MGSETLRCARSAREVGPAGPAGLAPRTPAGGRARRRRGLTMIEIVCALAVLVLGVLGFSQALLGALRANVTTREATLATQAARSRIETLQATAFTEVFALYNATDADDPPAGTAPGAGFAVPGLQALPGDADGLPGEIFFPVVAGAPGVLREDAGNAALGMPRDLDGDTFVDAGDHSGDYRLLPVLVRVTWRGTKGRGQVEVKTMLGAFE